MRTLLLFAALLVVVSGCKKAKPTTPPPAASGGTTTGAPGQTTPSVHAPTGVVVNPGTSGGSGGAVQAVRKAVGRAVSQNEMKNIQLFIENASGGGQMPSAQAIFQALQREAPATAKLVQDGDIVLTGIRQREGIWAYTKEAQSTAGYHLVVNNSGVERMMPQQLNQALQQQGR